MSRRPANVVVLAEDKCQWRFAYHYLKRLGIPPRAIHSRLSAGGSGEQSVRTQYPTEVTEYRRKRQTRALVVLIDADTGSVRDRHVALDAGLRASGVEGRFAGERIAVLVPRRNEEEDYKDRLGCEGVARAAGQFYELARPNAPDAGLDSLRIAIPEIQRIKE